MSISSPGGGGGGAAPSDLGQFWNLARTVELVNTHVLTKLQCWKSKHFLIMQIYVNYMHVFLFLIITDKMRPF